VIYANKQMGLLYLGDSATAVRIAERFVISEGRNFADVLEIVSSRGSLQISSLPTLVGTSKWRAQSGILSRHASHQIS
jgi:hypothetical protein